MCAFSVFRLTKVTHKKSLKVSACSLYPLLLSGLQIFFRGDGVAAAFGYKVVPFSISLSLLPLGKMHIDCFTYTLGPDVCIFSWSLPCFLGSFELEHLYLFGASGYYCFGTFCGELSLSFLFGGISLRTNLFSFNIVFFCKQKVAQHFISSASWFWGNKISLFYSFILSGVGTLLKNHYQLFHVLVIIFIFEVAAVF